MPTAKPSQAYPPLSVRFIPAVKVALESREGRFKAGLVTRAKDRGRLAEGEGVSEMREPWLAPCCADPALVIHYAPAELLVTIDQSAKAGGSR